MFFCEKLNLLNINGAGLLNVPQHPASGQVFLYPLIHRTVFRLHKYVDFRPHCIPLPLIKLFNVPISHG